MKIRENYDYRLIDIAYPREAATAIHALIMALVEAGVPERSLRSGPMAVGPGRCSVALNNMVMLLDSQHADKFLTDVAAAVAPFDVPEEEYGDYGK